MALLTALSVGSTLLGFGRGRKAAKANKRANELRLKMSRQRNVLARRQAAANLRRQRAAVSAAALASGTQGGSAAAGALGSISSQTQARLNQQRQEEAAGIDQYNLSRRADRYQQQQQVFGLVSSFANQAQDYLTNKKLADAANSQTRNQQAPSVDVDGLLRRPPPQPVDVDTIF